MAFVVLDQYNKVTSIFACPQPDMSNVVEVDDADQRLVDYFSLQQNFELRAQAQSALDKSDVTVLRCVSAGVAVPADIQVYRVALRAIATGNDTTSIVLPTKPTDYPQGT